MSSTLRRQRQEDGAFKASLASLGHCETLSQPPPNQVPVAAGCGDVCHPVIPVFGKRREAEFQISPSYIVTE